ncbi:MAG: MBL fold metallo-hydrolase, partial [Bacteroidetes bacterium]|nr:MBL fold metallo-hydrolase [Bacteroidota bacterium]
MAVFRSFGKNPSGTELDRIEASPNFKEGSFQNLSATTMMVSKIPMPVMLWKFLNKPKRTSPPSAIPSVKTNLKDLPADKATIVWFGHSSYLISINGIKILVDPVMSGHASPFSFG